MDVFRETVFVFDAGIGLLVEQDDVESFASRPQSRYSFGSDEGVWFTFVVERGAGEFHLAREIDSPIAVEIIVARHVADGQVIVGSFHFADLDVGRSDGDQQNVVVA